MWLSKVINTQAGGPVIAPWEVEQLPEEWLELALKMATDLPEMQKARQKAQKYFEKYRKEHPSYRKVK